MQDQADLVEAVLLGDSEEINRLGEQYSVAFEFAVELLQAIKDEVLNMDAFDGGRIVGRLIGEFEDSVKREPLIPAGAALGFTPRPVKAIQPE